MRELVIRRGKEFWEVRERDEPDSRFRTTKIPTRPPCQRPARCVYCDGLRGPNGVVMIMQPVMDADGIHVIHKLTPPQASHLVALDWCQAHPNEPIKVGWLLTSEEVEAGKRGQVWPEDV
jgi:hypothetical protein